MGLSFLRGSENTVVSISCLAILAGLFFGFLGILICAVSILVLRRYSFDGLRQYPVYVKNSIKILFDSLTIGSFGFASGIDPEVFILFASLFLIISVVLKVYREPFQFLTTSLVIKLSGVCVFSSSLYLGWSYLGEIFRDVKIITDSPEIGSLVALGLSPILLRALLVSNIRDLKTRAISGKYAAIFFSSRDEIHLEEYKNLVMGAGYKVIALVGEGKGERYRRRSLDGVPIVTEEGLSKAFEGIDEKIVITIRSSYDTEKYDTRKAILEASGYVVVQISNVRQSMVEGLLSEKNLASTLAKMVSHDTDTLAQELPDGDWRDSCALVTGGAGSIGAEITDVLLRVGFAKVVVIDNSEQNIFLLVERLKTSPSLTNFVPVFGDVTDRDGLDAVFVKHQPDVVFHAAALKHVPIVEDNVDAAFRVNVVGTNNILSLVQQHPVKRFCFISTDKAVNPSSVMGLTKRLGELAVDVSARKDEICRYCVVRFGNVIASSGSVLPIFAKQIKDGNRVTITHPDMERYFMTIPEAVGLVLKATLNLEIPQGESGLFILDMGGSHRITDVVKKMVEYSGKKIVENPTSDDEIRIEYTGIRPGEKVEEVLTTANENAVKSNIPKILEVHKRPFESVIEGLAVEFTLLPEDARRRAETWIAEFRLA